MDAMDTGASRLETGEGEAGEGRVARRRARVRRRLLEVAEELIAAHGVDAVTVDALADAADIARRSFYHYFESKNDVLVPLARARTREVNRRIDRLVDKIEDPAESMATGMRHAIRAIGTDPLCNWFVLRSGLPQERLYEGVGESGMRDAARGVEAGRFHIENVAVVQLLLSGAFLSVLAAYSDGKLREVDLDDAVEHMLRLLGLDRQEARDLAHRPLRRLPRRA